LSKQLQDILKEEKNAGRLTPNEEKVFTQIIADKQVEIFSNPKVAGPVGDAQSQQIISLINSMLYFQKEDAKFRVTIAPGYLQELVEYIEDRYDTFRADVGLIINQNVSSFVDDGLDQAFRVEVVKYMESVIRDVIVKGSEKKSFSKFINDINTNIIDKQSKETLIEKKKVIDYFIQLLPKSMQDRFSGEKNYLNELKLESMLNSQVTLFTDMYKQETIIANSVMTFKGSFIKSSEIVREIGKSSKVTSINVNAFQAIYFDVGLDLRDYLDLTIISPKWNVENSTLKTIDLSSTYVPPVDPKATNAVVPGTQGYDGLPGLPGRNAVNFFGFGYRFANLGEFHFCNFLIYFFSKLQCRNAIH
jgi:hypothetical protein